MHNIGQIQLQLQQKQLQLKFPMTKFHKSKTRKVPSRPSGLTLANRCKILVNLQSTNPPLVIVFGA